MAEITAEAILEAGYGTDVYDPETNECFWEAYASMYKVISGDWSMYDYQQSNALNHDFELGCNFDRWRVKRYSDGTFTKEILRRGNNACRFN